MPGHFERMAHLSELYLFDLEVYAGRYLEQRRCFYCRDFGWMNVIPTAVAVYLAELETSYAAEDPVSR